MLVRLMSSHTPSKAAGLSGGTRLVRRGAVVVWLGVVVLAALGVTLGVRPPPGLERGSVTVDIPTNLGLLGIARRLAEQGAIRSQVVFVGLTVLRGTARSLKAGEYE